MKKTYTLAIEGKNRDRLLDAAKHDIRKYIKRERAKALPTGVDFWDFDCKTGLEPASANPVHSAELFGAIDALVKDAGDAFYVEVQAKPGHRTARQTGEATGSSNPGLDDDDSE